MTGMGRTTDWPLLESRAYTLQSTHTHKHIYTHTHTHTHTHTQSSRGDEPCRGDKSPGQTAPHIEGTLANEADLDVDVDLDAHYN